MSELRLVLTNACNFKCFFCHGEGSKTKVENRLDADDYKFLFLQAMKILDTTKISLTGGEPMVRTDIIDIVKSIYKAGAKITMTSNFALISRHMEIGKYVSKMNISFHVFDDKLLNDIIGVQCNVSDLINGIKEFSCNYPNVKICLNCTVNKKNCDEENLMKIIEFANEINANVNLSEMYSDNLDEIIGLNDFREKLIQQGFSLKDFIYGRSQRYIRKGQEVKLSKILCVAAKSSENPQKYCKDHRDLFIMPDGKIDICREKEIYVDLLKEIKDRNHIELLRSLESAISMMGNGCK